MRSSGNLGYPPTDINFIPRVCKNRRDAVVIGMLLLYQGFTPQQQHSKASLRPRIISLMEETGVAE